MKFCLLCPNVSIFGYPGPTYQVDKHSTEMEFEIMISDKGGVKQL